MRRGRYIVELTLIRKCCLHLTYWSTVVISLDKEQAGGSPPRAGPRPGHGAWPGAGSPILNAPHMRSAAQIVGSANYDGDQVSSFFSILFPMHLFAHTLQESHACSEPVSDRRCHPPAPNIRSSLHFLHMNLTRLLTMHYKKDLSAQSPCQTSTLSIRLLSTSAPRFTSSTHDSPAS